MSGPNLLVYLIGAIVGFNAKAATGIDPLLVEQCQELRSPECSQSRQSSLRQALGIATNLCRHEMEDGKCSDLVQGNHELATRLRSCEIEKICEDQLSGATLMHRLGRLDQACRAGFEQAQTEFVKSMITMAKAILGVAITNSSERTAFLSECDQRLSIKRRLVSEIPVLAKLSDRDLGGVSCNELLTRVQAYQESETKIAEIIYAQSHSRRRTDSASEDGNLEARRRERFEKFIGQLDHWLDRNGFATRCFDAKTRWELRCFALFKEVVDPISLVTGAGGATWQLIRQAGTRTRNGVRVATSVDGRASTSIANGLSERLRSKLTHLTADLRAKVLRAREKMSPEEQAFLDREFDKLVGENPRACRR